MESGESNLYHLPQALESASMAQALGTVAAHVALEASPPAASLSPELLAALALDAEGRIAIGSWPWRAHIVLDQAALGPTHLLPQAFDFFTRPLEDRFATITHYNNLIMAGYQAEGDDPDVLALAERAAHELANGLGLDDSAIFRVRVISTLDNQRRLHAVPTATD